MNCQQFQEVLQDLAGAQMLEDPFLKDSLEHAESCDRCDALLREAEGLTNHLRSLAAFDSARQAPAHVEASLLEAFQQHALARKKVVRQNPKLHRVAVTSLLGIAALALFAILLFQRWQPEESPAGSRPAASPAPAARTSNGRESASILEPSMPAIQQDDALSAFEDEEGTAASFVPLTEDFDPTALEGGTVLRVTMPRTTLRTFGLNVEQSLGEPVLADMLVTSDGTPQAIRLLGR